MVGITLCNNGNYSHLGAAVSRSHFPSTRSIFLATAFGMALIVGMPIVRQYSDPNRGLKDAATAGFNRAVSGFLSLGANIHADRDAALRWAAVNGQTRTVALLLDRGADVHAQSDFALRFAAANGRTDTVKLLLDRGANIHARGDEALRLARYSNHAATERLLLEHGADAVVAENPPAHPGAVFIAGPE